MANILTNRSSRPEEALTSGIVRCSEPPHLGYSLKMGLLCVFLLAGLAGCQTRQSAPPPIPYSPTYPGMAQPQQPMPVLVRGDVKNQVIPWTEDLTLARAIVAADYQSVFDPRTILVIRQGQV